MADGSSSLPDRRIVLLGKTGSGRSSTGNTIIGDFVFNQGCSAKSMTRRCERRVTAVEEDKIISVIDTPGLYDTSVSEEELKKEILKCFYMSAPGPHVFLLVIRLGVKFTEEEKKTVTWIQENFGEEASHHSIILFTHTDLLKSLSLDEYISESDDLKALVDECGGRFHSFNNEDMSNRSQVTELLKKIDEMVRINGGQHYTSDIFKEAQRRTDQEALKQILRNCGQTALKLIGGGIGGGIGGVVGGGVGGGVGGWVGGGLGEEGLGLVIGGVIGGVVGGVVGGKVGTEAAAAGVEAVAKAAAAAEAALATGAGAAAVAGEATLGKENKETKGK